MRLTHLTNVTARFPRVFLSPHLDDVAYSCSGLISRLTRAGCSSLVVTVCGGIPDAGVPLSSLARDFHQEMGASRESDAATVIAMRHHEDRQVLNRLGVDYLWLDYLDAVYRGQPPYYAALEQLIRGDIHLDDQQFCDRLIADLLPIHQRYPSITWYAPLGIGRHIDHQLVSQAARVLMMQGASVIWYEDFPYVLRDGLLAARLTELGLPLMPEIIDISSVLPQRIEAIINYSSQIMVNFGRHADIPGSITMYTHSIAEAPAIHAERYWTMSRS